MIQATYAGEVEYNNTKGLMFKLTFSGNYGGKGVGDLINLAPVQSGSNPTGVLDPNNAYNLILDQPPKNFGVLNTLLGGSYVGLNPNANPTLKNLGVLMYEPGGAEKDTGAAYTAAELAGSVLMVAFVPLQ